MACFRVAVRRSEHVKYRVAVYALAAGAFLAPVLIYGQCQPIGASSTAHSAASQAGLTSEPEFFDEPQFTVAGVTDTTSLGGHGSDARVRTTDALARDTVSLGKESAASSGAASPAPGAATEKSLREAAEHTPGDFELNHRLGKFLVETGKAADAIPYLERASKLKPGDYGNRYELALAHTNVGDYQVARESLRSLLVAQDKAEPHHLLGDIEEKLGNPLQAAREYQRAAELDPSEPNLFDWGTELLIHHAPEPAIEVFTKGNRLYPHSLRMLVAMGVSWYARGSYDQAAYHLCRASDLNPQDPSPYLFLGNMLSVESRPSEGIAQRLERFARLEPDNALANYYYALSLWKQRKGSEDTQTRAQAQALLEKAVQLDPKLAVGYLQLGILHAERKDFPNAISAYHKAIETGPQLEEPHYRLAQAYRQAGEPLKAQKEIELYKQLSKQSAEDAARRRHEMQQLVYTLRHGTATSPPQSPQ